MDGMLIFGDSIVSGRGEIPNIGWVGRLKKDFENSPHKSIFNLGIPGDTSTNLFKRFETEIKAREARTVQESLLPNPEIDFEIENFSGSGEVKGAETTISIGQLIELGGKRSKRTKIAALQSDIALLHYEKKRLDIITQVRSIFLNVLNAQKKLKLDHQLQDLALSFKTTIDTLVQAGRLSTAESARAQVELSNRKLI